MSMPVPAAPLPPVAAAPVETSAADLASRLEAACRRVAPLWPLDRFVAVNPYLGLSGLSFAEAAARLERHVGARLVMPRSFYRDAHAAGRITREDLAAALAAANPRPALTLDGLVAALASPDRQPSVVARTAADVVDATTGGRFAELAVEDIGKVCAAWFDEGQASWPFPWKGLPLYAAWRAAMRHDRSAEILGVADFRKTVAGLPSEPRDAALAALAELGLTGAAVDLYCDRALASVAGWAGAARQRLWDAELAGQTDDALAGVLAIRLAFDVAVLRAHGTPAVRQAWAAAVAAMAVPAAPDGELAVDVVLQDAYERGYQRMLLAALARPPVAAATPPDVQAVFCIDVRSEVFRRALETVSPAVETRGFAGFFGVTAEVVGLGRRRGASHAPVLLRPSAVVCEAVGGDPEPVAMLAAQRVRDRLAAGWSAFRSAAVASFGFVETMGLSYAPKLAAATLGHGPAPRPSGPLAGQTAPTLAPRDVAGRRTGLTLEQRIGAAEGFLRGVSLTEGFAPLVLLAGHGSTSANNPHAAGLDCGACGGQTGEASARIACLVLNDAEVRDALARRGIAVPAQTWFVAGLHDTTTDVVSLHDEDVPASHAGHLGRLRAALAAAGRLARAERAAGLGLAGAPDLAVACARRSRDWSQVRPEWGLAGNAAFVAAPRARTRELALGGRAFLHDYDWRRDEGFAVLATIMTAPMVVASWINLQYLGSTVDNAHFGSGSKMLHNVVGLMGVLEGAGGDLRPGLPLQSLSDGDGLRHEPVRLTVAIEAPADAIAGVVARHDGVRELVANGWVHLFSLDADGTATRIEAR